MTLVRINHNPSRRQLAVFLVLWLAAFATLGFVLKIRGYPGTAAAICLALLVPLVGWAAPRFARTVYLGMSYLAMPISLVVSYAVLAVAFYLVLAPTGLLLRVLGHDPMNRRFDRQAETYWVRRKADREPGRYFRQY